MKDLEDFKSKKYGRSSETEISQSEFECLQSIEDLLNDQGKY